MIVDVRASKDARAATPAASLAFPADNGSFRQSLIVRRGAWVRNHVTIRGNEITVRNSDPEPRVIILVAKLNARRSIGLVGNSTGAVEFGNVYIRSLK
jgi:hypothetical protein